MLAVGIRPSVKRSLFSGALCSAFLTVAPAGAADLPLKTPSSAAPAASSPWSGFYLGGGLGFQASNTGETLDLTSLGGHPLQTPAVVEPFTATSEPLNGIAFRGSAFAGYNWQVARHWVLGIEADAGSARQTTTFAGLGFPDQTLSVFDRRDGISARTTWDASTRGRAGFLATPTTLVYATGGAAWQHYEISTTSIALALVLSGGQPGGPFSVTPAVTTNSATKAGWTIGSGIESALGGHWFARAEYRFADFGTSTFTITRNTTFLPINPIVNIFDVPFRTHTASFGLAYKFGDEVASSPVPAGWLDGVRPVKALAVKATPLPLWSGLYAGLGVGLRASVTEATTAELANNPILFSPNFAASEPLNGTAFRASPYLGWNWQIAPRWVTGIEGEVGIANQTTSLPGLGFSPGVPAFELAKDEAFAVRTSWDASLRGRLGFLATSVTLVYATAGAAWQHFDVISTCNSDFGPPSCGGALFPIVVTNSATKAGWTAGLGAETMLGGNWLARAEYRYADFGSSSFAITRTDNAGGAVSTNFEVGLRTHTATFGLSYKFGGLGSFAN